MKDLLLITVVYILSNYAYAQETDSYYYYGGNRKYISKIESEKYVFFNSGEEFLELINKVKEFDHEILKYSIDIGDNIWSNWAIVKRDYGTKNNFEYLREKYYVAPFFEIESGETTGASHIFYVKLKSQEDLNLLKRYAKELNVNIVSQNKFMPLWYTLSCSADSDTENSITAANYFYETGDFEAAHPDLIVGNALCGTSNNYYSSQWGLENTGQYGGVIGIDINYSTARNITMGDNNVKVAIFESGFAFDHPDLNNVSGIEYDTETNPQTNLVDRAHGTACAGIVGANATNSKGVVGIAPNAQLLSIYNDMIVPEDDPGNIVFMLEIADGFNWAASNNIDIVSNSWSNNAIESDLVNDAILNALTNGRHGLGAILVFASGNANTNVSYPANCPYDVIAVGAMSHCGERKSLTSCDGEDWGSNYSVGDDTSLDIMAPGVLISTTDMLGNEGYNPNQPIHLDNGGEIVSNDFDDTDYTVWFTGTSSACPHVAAVAALILSVNSGLTYEEVGDIIANTAQKVGGYNYQADVITGRGTWNNEVGHGLIDAGEAVKLAYSNYPITNTSYSSSVTLSGSSDIVMSNVVVEQGGALNIENLGNSLIINGEFNAQIGSILNIHP